MINLKEVWNQISSDIKQEIGIDDYIRWFSFVTILRYDNKCLILAVPSRYFGDWFLPQNKSIILKYSQSFFDKDMKIYYEVSDKIPIQKKKAVEINQKLISKSSTAKKNFAKLSFENFIVGDNNEFAYAFARKITENPKNSEINSFFLYGSIGLGKTHLLNSIKIKAQELNKGLKVKYTTSDSFLNDYINAVIKKGQGLKEFRDYYRSLDILLIDDVQFFARKEKFQEEFFHTFNDLVQNGKQIVMSSDKEPRELRGLEKRLVSRFQNGQVVEIKKPDYEVRLAILKQKQRLTNCLLSEEILEYIATNIKSNIRPLEGAINRLSFLQSMKKSVITLEKCRELISSYVDIDEKQNIGIGSIIEEVSRYYSVSSKDILKRDRSKNIAIIRQIAMYLSRSLTDQSLPSIGEKFSRNHATISHAYKVVETRLATDRELQRSIETLTEAIK